MRSNDCCEWFARALNEEGTDNEGYSTLIYLIEPGHPVSPYETGDEPGLHMGLGFPTIKFCPWCGKAKEDYPNA